MDRAAGAVSLQARQTKTFSDNALAGKRRVAMDQQRKNFAALSNVVQLVLLGAHLAQHHRIDNLKM